MNVFKMIVSMVIFGSIGIVVSEIPLPSVLIAGLRAFLGALFLAVVMILRRKPINKNAVGKNLGLLIVSGIAIAVNWILLFESYRYTSVAVATLCYYMAPVFVTLLSPLLLKERLTFPKFLCMFAAVTGVVLISSDSLIGNTAELKGVALALGAAALYAAVVMMNKKIRNLPDQETTFFQLLTAAIITLPYALFTQGTSFTVSSETIVWLLVVGIVHTGVAYMLFFGAVAKLPAQSTALLSYIDPVTAVLLSAFWLRQPMGLFDIIGAVLIIGAALLGELVTVKFKKRRR